MDLTTFLKYYKATNEKTFGEFVRSRRTEYGYSLREFAKILGISAVYLSDIENGNRPAPTKALPVFMIELHITLQERKAFLDLVELSRKSFPEIENYLANHPSARKFMKLASEKGIPDKFFDQLIEVVNNKVAPKDSSSNNNENSSER